MKYYALIVAGGSGSRMNTAVPKQFLLLNNRPVLMHTIDCFSHFTDSIEIAIVLPEAQFSYWKELCEIYHFQTPHLLIAGGTTRFESVKNGLAAFHEEGIVAIHDGVRPLVSQETLMRCFTIAEEKGNALPVMPIVESLRKVEYNQNIAADRTQFVSIQTPQVFHLNQIRLAYQQPYNPLFTDDATVLEGLKIGINLVEGNIENIKITHKTDLKIAQLFMSSPE